MSAQRILLARLALCVVVTACGVPSIQETTPSSGFTNFETEAVRPLALSADGRYLYALNTADDRLEVFETTDAGLRSLGETMVGLRPVALALRGARELWVVNHLSDSVNVVDVSEASRPRVVRTLSVGDEPRGIVAAGPEKRRIFVAAARRGESLQPGLGRAQLWVFDADQPQKPPQEITLFGAKPRALAASPDGKRVYAAVFHSGNGTTSVGGFAAGKLGRAPVYDPESPPSADEKPKTGAIVRRIDGQWRDFDGLDWSSLVSFELPDYDVFVIDATSEPPAVIDRISGVGTVLFDIAVRPDDGEIWVSNTEANNQIPHEPRLRAHFAENRVTRLIPDGVRWNVLASHLNPHVDRRQTPGSLHERQQSLAQPLEMVFDLNGDTAYVAAFGSRSVAVLSRDARVMDRIGVGFGPAGLALDSGRQRLYVLNRLDASISVIDTQRRRTIATVALRHDPTPEIVKAGRPLLYDAAKFSGHGTLSCASCHVFADFDGLAWDLGDPEGTIEEVPMDLRHDVLAPLQAFHPLKGAMATQSLRGLVNTAPLHWRGDRFGRGARQPGEDMASFKDFARAYVDLMGLDAAPDDASMEAFARFVHTIRYPPNPNERLDRRLTREQRAGFAFFNGDFRSDSFTFTDGPFRSDRGVQTCSDCHTGPLGTNRLINFEGFQAGRDMKTPHLRNVYQKVGRFDQPGPQVAGFGMGHDGSVDTVVRLLEFDNFIFPGESEAEKDALRRQLNAFVMGFPSGMAPAVGLQVTISGDAQAEQTELLGLMVRRADEGDCDLIARSWDQDQERGWLWRDQGFVGNRAADPALDLDRLLERRQDVPVTFLCVPPGDGLRSALDRDLDGRFDGDQGQQ
jgi:DNA-binding beta-propeller fold protein YncE